MSTSAELLSDIKTAIVKLQERYSLSSVGKAFLMWYATVELDLGAEEAEEAVGYDGGNEKIN
jgi:hypothetical protein